MLGDVIKRVRTGQKQTIKEIAEKAGITSSLLSQIENNKANPSINSLMAIAKALNVPISSFFNDDDDHRATAATEPVVRADNRKFIKTQSGVTFYSLTPEPRKHSIEFIYNVYEQGGSTGEMYTHEGEECGYVLEGKLEVTYEGHTYILEAGDSIVLDSTKPHKLTNVHDGQTIAIWADSPPSW
ncbi:cupin domain-containing protein [candidate division KSB3 bacterium]|uniref:Cupin domain-containing protein n=1 Tax=candidate division KSB3 bacterium TaxID=2044937 RepID=A0A9D5JYE4_9BACT|nr:cupin domain-containing protein [candidate division KSB3 bacterium]MBD3326479.1 cupin domain-containing protein [candidate division KSB3 bacterium]